MSYMGRRLILAWCAKSNRDGSEMRIAKFKIWTLVVNDCRPGLRSIETDPNSCELTTLLVENSTQLVQ